MNLNKIEYIYSEILDKIHFGKVLSEKVINYFLNTK
jgi:hypothetical protein